MLSTYIAQCHCEAFALAARKRDGLQLVFRCASAFLVKASNNPIEYRLLAVWNDGGSQCEALARATAEIRFVQLPAKTSTFIEIDRYAHRLARKNSLPEWGGYRIVRYPDLTYRTGTLTVAGANFSQATRAYLNRNAATHSVCHLASPRAIGGRK